MSPLQKDLVKATVPVLKEHGVLLTTHFYNRMFTHNPELKHLFNMGNQQNQRQQTALAMAVLAYAENIEDPSVLLPVVDSIGHKHASLHVRPEHYAIVGGHLIASIGEVLGEAATPELLGAWTAAYNQLAALMSGHEQKLYDEKVTLPGGWSGWRPFVVRKKVRESEEITSFYLHPVDGGAVADFKPGQYVSLRIFLPEYNLQQPRQYSLSSAPNGEYYRISVKREAGSRHPDGMISNRLHDFVEPGDIVDLSAPSGNFTLRAQENKPQVFISGGVGQTPLISMLETLVRSGATPPITWVHGCRNERVHAFKTDLLAISGQVAEVEKHFFYDSAEKLAGNEYLGRVSLDQLPADALHAEAEYYICGPRPFIQQHYRYLVDRGIDRSNIHFEEFGPLSFPVN
ncbi:NO-inducible flavohemoprotein [Dyadobacter sp. 676]|uniref:Flavohemoprotein n=1 Tax=Dyadobacter sp. 676 TaxID=3088362 RepID=A0AAU8FG43_9BACT